MKWFEWCLVLALSLILLFFASGCGPMGEPIMSVTPANAELQELCDSGSDRWHAASGVRMGCDSGPPLTFGIPDPGGCAAGATYYDGQGIVVLNHQHPTCREEGAGVANSRWPFPGTDALAVVVHHELAHAMIGHRATPQHADSGIMFWSAGYGAKINADSLTWF